MTPYESYMAKHALNGVTKRLEFVANEVSNLSRAGKVNRGVQHTMQWHDGTPIADLDVEHRNIPGGEKWHAPDHTASIDWIDAGSHLRGAYKAGLGGAMRSTDLMHKFLGRAARGAHEAGMQHMAGDWGGVYTTEGRKFTADKAQTIGHAPVKWIDAPAPVSAGSKTPKTGYTTPIMNLDEHFANARKGRMENREAQTTVPPHDMLNAPRQHVDDSLMGWRGLVGLPPRPQARPMAPQLPKGKGYGANPYL